jgi:hypothetical protein
MEQLADSTRRTWCFLNQFKTGLQFGLLGSRLLPLFSQGGGIVQERLVPSRLDRKPKFRHLLRFSMLHFAEFDLLFCGGLLGRKFQHGILKLRCQRLRGSTSADGGTFYERFRWADGSGQAF